MTVRTHMMMSDKTICMGGAKSRLLIPILSVTILAIVAGGCTSNQKRAIGLQRHAPDEFDVFSRAPLSIPPDFRLAEPDPGAESLSDIRADEAPRTTVFGTDDLDDRVFEASNLGSAASQTTGERSLLGRAGAQNSRTDIRRIIDREARAFDEADDSFVNKILDFGTGGAGASSNEVLVDAQEETRRIRENRALGRPVSSGETPELEPPARTNPLQRIFNNTLGR